MQQNQCLTNNFCDKKKSKPSLSSATNSCPS